MMLAEETNINLSQEIHVLKGALGMKEGLSDGALGSQARLLHQLSKVANTRTLKPGCHSFDSWIKSSLNVEISKTSLNS